MSKPKYVITAKKVEAFDGPDSLCYNADIYVNGKKVATANNTGNGGMSSWWFEDRTLENAISKWAETLPKEPAGFDDPENPGQPYMMDVTLEGLIDAAVYDVFNAREEKKEAAKFRSKMKKTLFFRRKGEAYAEGEANTLKCASDDPRGKEYLEKKYGEGGYVIVAGIEDLANAQEAAA